MLRDPHRDLYRISARRHALNLGVAGLAVIAMPALWLGPRATAAAPKLRPTPAQTEGPFYPVALPSDNDGDLLHNGSREYRHGQATWVEGSLTDTAGRPVRGAQIEIWQCDHNGRYHHPGDGDQADPDFQGFGRVAVDSRGQWRFRTLKPVSYGGRAPHIHVKVVQDEHDLLTTQLYVEGDPHNAGDVLWRQLRNAAERAALTVPFRPVSDGLLARFPIVVAA